MSNYVVWWGTGIVADTVIEAAEQAQHMMQQPGIQWGFKVVNLNSGEEFEANLDTGIVRGYKDPGNFGDIPCERT